MLAGYFIKLQSLLIDIIFITETEGIHFVRAFPPSYYDDHVPIVTISTKHGTNVSLSNQHGTQTFYVANESSVNYTASPADRIKYGIETKGFELTSDELVSVHIGAEHKSNYELPDDILMRPVTVVDTEYIISSYPGTDISTSWPGSYFMIIPKSDQTLVQVYSFENNIWLQQYSGILNQFDVLTQDSYYADDGYTDYTGWRVLANKPVAVISGHGDANFGTRSQHTCDSMPSIATMGETYITFPVSLDVVRKAIQ